MMLECNGWIGKIFGHKFVSKIIKYEPPDVTSYDRINGRGSRLSEFINSISKKEYKIICKRCGKEQ